MKKNIENSFKENRVWLIRVPLRENGEQRRR